LLVVRTKMKKKGEEFGKSFSQGRAGKLPKEKEHLQKKPGLLKRGRPRKRKGFCEAGKGRPQKKGSEIGRGGGGKKARQAGERKEHPEKLKSSASPRKKRLDRVMRFPKRGRQLPKKREKKCGTQYPKILGPHFRAGTRKGRGKVAESVLKKRGGKE